MGLLQSNVWCVWQQNGTQPQLGVQVFWDMTLCSEEMKCCHLQWSAEPTHSAVTS